MADRLRDVFKPDPRAMLAFRVLLGTTLFFDLWNRLYNAKYFYIESGVLPRWLAKPAYETRFEDWSLHFFSNDLFVYGLLFFQLVLAVCLILGWRTRTVCLISWVLLISMHLRNPLLFYGGDKMASLLMLVAIFLPLDSAQRQKDDRLRWPIPMFALFVLSLVVAIAYFHAGQAKFMNPLWRDGTALNLIFDNNLLTKPLARQFLQFPWLCQVMCLITPWLEMVIPFFVFVPLWRGKIRVFGLLGLLSLNIGIHFMFDVGYFKGYTTAGIVACLPACFWDTLSPLTRRLYQSVSSCFGRVANGVIQFDLANSTTVIGEQSVDGDSVFKWRTGVSARIYSVFSSLLLIFLTVLFIATLFEATGLCRLPTPVRMRRVVNTLHLYQSWKLFHITNPNCYGYVGKCRLANGDWVDLLQDGEPVSWGRQEGPNKLFQSNSKWRLIFAKTGKFNQKKLLRSRVAYVLVRHWNDHHPPEQGVEELKIMVFKEKLPSTGNPSWHVWWGGEWKKAR